MNLINFVEIEIKLDTEKNQIHNELYFKIKFNIRNDGHFGQFKTFSKKAKLGSAMRARDLDPL
jgi:hypothetical protein